MVKEKTIPKKEKKTTYKNIEVQRMIVIEVNNIPTIALFIYDKLVCDEN